MVKYVLLSLFGKRLGTLKCCCFLAPLGKNLVSEDATSLITRFCIEEQKHFCRHRQQTKTRNPCNCCDLTAAYTSSECHVGPRRNISREPSYVSISYYLLDFEDSMSKSTFWKRSQVFWCKSHDTYTSDLHFAPWAQQLQRLQGLGRPIKVADLPEAEAEVVRKRKMEETTPTLGLEASCQTNRGFRSHGGGPQNHPVYFRMFMGFLS